MTSGTLDILLRSKQESAEFSWFLLFKEMFIKKVKSSGIVIPLFLLWRPRAELETF